MTVAATVAGAEVLHTAGGNMESAAGMPLAMSKSSATSTANGGDNEIANQAANLPPSPQAAGQAQGRPHEPVARNLGRRSPGSDGSGPHAGDSGRQDD